MKAPAPADACHLDEELRGAYARLGRDGDAAAWLRNARERLFPKDLAERHLTGVAQAVVTELSHRRYAKLAQFIGPDGLCLRVAKGAECRTLTAKDLATCEHSGKRTDWGAVDGSGAPHRYTCAEAFQKIFYARDFLRSTQVNFNCFPEPGRGNNAAPIVVTEPRPGYVEFFHPGAGEPTGSPRSLWLVFDGTPEDPRLVELVSEFWSI